MKKIFSVFVSLILMLALSTSAFAAGTDASGDTSTPADPEQTVPNVNVYVTNDISTTEDLGEYVGTSIYALNPIDPSDASGLKSVMLEVLGPYDAIVVEHQYESYNGSVNYVREIQLDYVWLCSCGLFVVVLFCILRGGFAVLCKL